MKKKVVAPIIASLLVLAACAPAGTTTAPATTAPTTSATTAAPTTVPPTTKPAADVPKYGSTLNLLSLTDITDWSQGLTFC